MRPSTDGSDSDPRVAAALHTPVDVDVDAAWLRLSRTRPAVKKRSGFRALIRRPAFGFLAVAIALTGAGTAAANDWLQIFQTQKIAAISFSPDDLVALPDLSAYGEVKVSGPVDVHPVADEAAAASETKLDVPDVTALPRGVTGLPAYQVGDQVTATFTFDAARAALAAKKAGTSLPPPPAGLDGHAVRLVAGPGVVETWGSEEGVPALLVGRAIAPKAFSEGVSFETVRDYLLSLPWLSPRLAAQLRTFAADGSTLPVPVPEQQVMTSQAELNGVTATVLRSRDHTMSAVVWVKDGVMTLVAGSLDSGEVVDVARKLT